MTTPFMSIPQILLWLWSRLKRKQKVAEVGTNSSEQQRTRNVDRSKVYPRFSFFVGLRLMDSSWRTTVRTSLTNYMNWTRATWRHHCPTFILVVGNGYYPLADLSSLPRITAPFSLYPSSDSATRGTLHHYSRQGHEKGWLLILLRSTYTPTCGRGPGELLVIYSFLLRTLDRGQHTRA